MHKEERRLVNPRRACAVRVTVVGLSACVCLSVKSNITYGASVCPQNNVTHSAGNRGKTNLWDFL